MTEEGTKQVTPQPSRIVGEHARRRVPAGFALFARSEGREAIEVGQDPSVLAHCDVQAMRCAVLPQRDLARMQNAPDRRVGTGSPRATDRLQELPRVFNRKIGTAASGPDLADLGDARGDPELLQPLVERCEGAPQIGIRTGRRDLGDLVGVRSLRTGGLLRDRIVHDAPTPSAAWLSLWPQRTLRMATLRRDRAHLFLLGVRPQR